MIYEIQNTDLKVKIASLGGELLSIQTTDETEYLWQGDAATWEDHAPNLFPYIARLTDGKYTYKGVSYEMDIHGFLKDTELACEKQDDHTLVLYMEDTGITKKQYPFSFRLRLIYTLEGSGLHVSYQVENKGTDTMYFGIGGHPGFCVPFDGDLDFEDYHLQFNQDSSPTQILFTADCFVTDQERELILSKDKTLPLRHSLFDDDAIILHSAGKEIELKSNQSGRSVVLDFADFPYLGLWHFPQAEVGYICLEPWSSLPSRKGIVEDLETQKDLLSLDAGDCCEKSWHLRIK